MLGLPDGPLFAFAFDFLHSVLDRKNPLGLVDAYLQAFPQPGEASLVLKTINGNARHPVQPRSHPARDRRSPRHRADRRALDAPRDAGAHRAVRLLRVVAPQRGVRSVHRRGTMAAGRPVITDCLLRQHAVLRRRHGVAGVVRPGAGRPGQAPLSRRQRCGRNRGSTRLPHTCVGWSSTRTRLPRSVGAHSGTSRSASRPSEAAADIAAALGVPAVALSSTDGRRMPRTVGGN